MIVIRQLGEEGIHAAYELAVAIFGADVQDEKHREEKWREHLGQHGLLLGAFDDEKLVGFKFGYQREPGAFHSWLGGVEEGYRRYGIAGMLMEKQEQWAMEQGFVSITVTTVRGIFPGMYQLLLKNGYKVESEEIDPMTKSFFRKSIS